MSRSSVFSIGLCVAALIVGLLVMKGIFFRPVYTVEPGDGIRLESGAISNVTNRAKEGSIHDAMKLANHYLIAEHNVTNAIECLKMAANYGSSEAAYNLGQLYANEPAIRDSKLATYWYSKAAQMGNTNAIQKGFSSSGAVLEK